MGWSGFILLPLFNQTKKHNDSILSIKHITELFHSQNLKRSRSTLITLNQTLLNLKLSDYMKMKMVARN
jgi:hypothetical protein